MCLGGDQFTHIKNGILTMVNSKLNRSYWRLYRTNGAKPHDFEHIFLWLRVLCEQFPQTSLFQGLNLPYWIQGSKVKPF